MTNHIKRILKIRKCDLLKEDIELGLDLLSFIKECKFFLLSAFWQKLRNNLLEFLGTCFQGDIRSADRNILVGYEVDPYFLWDRFFLFL